MQKDICLRYAGLMRKVCLCGISFQQITGNKGDFGIYKRIPCFGRNRIDTCKRRVFPTDAYIKRFEDKANTNHEYVVIALQTIKEINKDIKKDKEGVIVCPQCKGKLHYSIVGYNGHIWGKCETKGCISWMM